MGKALQQVTGFYNEAFVESHYKAINTGILIQMPALPYYLAYKAFESSSEKKFPPKKGSSGWGIAREFRTKGLVLLYTCTLVLPLLTIASFAIALTVALLLAVTAPVNFGIAAAKDAITECYRWTR